MLSVKGRNLVCRGIRADRGSVRLTQGGLRAKFGDNVCPRVVCEQTPAMMFCPRVDCEQSPAMIFAQG